MVRLHHGKDFKIGLDFVLVGEEEVAVEKIYPGYPAFKSEAVAVGDVISTVNGTTIRSPAQAVEAMKCRYGRGTDEVVEIIFSGNQEGRVREQLQRNQASGDSRRPSVGQVVRSLSWSKKNRKSKQKENRKSTDWSD